MWQEHEHGVVRIMSDREMRKEQTALVRQPDDSLACVCGSLLPLAAGSIPAVRLNAAVGRVFPTGRWRLGLPIFIPLVSSH